MDHNTRHLIALILFGAGTVLGIVGVTNWAVACISAGLFVVTF